MHGYEPGTVEPTTELLMSHKHPDDRGHVQDLLDRALLSKSSFSSRHRFIDTAGIEHDAIVVADRMSDANGAVVGTARLLPRPHRRPSSRTARWPSTRRYRTCSRPGPSSSRPKGILMAIYRVSPEQAFGVLRWRSQETNTKLRSLAKQVITEMSTQPAPSADVQAAFDHLLLTVHERIPGESTT